MSKNRTLKIRGRLVEERSLGSHKLVFVDGELSAFDFRHTVDRVKHRQAWWHRSHRQDHSHRTVKLGELLYPKLVA